MKILFNMTTQVCDSPILITDIKIESNWPLYQDDSKAIERLYYKNKVGNFRLNEELFLYCKELYKQAGVWTWKRDISKECNVYEI